MMLDRILIFPIKLRGLNLSIFLFYHFRFSQKLEFLLLSNHDDDDNANDSATVSVPGSPKRHSKDKINDSNLHGKMTF